VAASVQAAPPADVPFRATDVQTGWGVVYAVRVADVNADGKPDILAINPTQMAWFENPSWQRHVIVPGRNRARCGLEPAQHALGRRALRRDTR
jgi:hypothetical protein